MQFARKRCLPFDGLALFHRSVNSYRVNYVPQVCLRRQQCHRRRRPINLISVICTQISVIFQMITNDTQIKWMVRKRAVMRSGCGNRVCIWTINGFRFLCRHLAFWIVENWKDAPERNQEVRSVQKTKKVAAKLRIAFDSRETSANRPDCEVLRLLHWR